MNIIWEEILRLAAQDDRGKISPGRYERAIRALKYTKRDKPEGCCLLFGKKN